MIHLFRIYIDLDGVLADFDGRVKQFLGGYPNEFTDDYLWRHIKNYNDKYKPFFETMPLMPGALFLFDNCLYYHIVGVADVKILTATGYSIEDAGEQKKKWVQRHLSTNVEVLTVTSGRDKAQYADPYSILIDDRKKATEPFEEAGGIAILHESPHKSIVELDKIMMGLLGGNNG